MSVFIIFFHRIRWLIVGLGISFFPFLCYADDTSPEEIFKNEKFDFSNYKPDPHSDDLYTVYHIIPSGIVPMDYHKSVYYFGMMLSKEKGSIPGSSGYYLNRSKYHPHAVRITLFTRNEDDAKEINNWIHDLVKNKLITIVPYVFSEPNHGVFSKEYGGDEHDFRKYLSLYTPICIECMCYNFNETQKIWNDLMAFGGTDITFLEHSRFFMRLSYEERCRFIDAMYKRKWGHMVINFVLGHDEDK